MSQNQVWFLWAVNLLAQNYFASSGSLKRRAVANALASALWILQFQLMVGPLLEYLNGKHGVLAQVGVAAYYTAFAVAGQVLARYWAGKASPKYAQITDEAWSAVLEKCGKCELPEKAERLCARIESFENCVAHLRNLESTAQKVADDYNKLDYGSVVKLTQGKSMTGGA